ncbi:MAG: FAD-binding protein [bacterium JZ-2024 1]
MAELRFDAIVVGAGPAGIAAGITMAKGGMKVLVIEKGRKPGVKNVMGGVLYTKSLLPLVPDIAKIKQVWERPITEENFWLLTPEDALKFGFRSPSFLDGIPNAFTVFRVKFDEWLFKEAKSAGCLLLPSTKVEQVLMEDGHVVGVATDRPDGNIYAPLVILAEGAYAVLAQQTGLVPKLRKEHFALAVKEVLSLPSSKIEDRFHLEKGAGATVECFGYATKNMLGYAFIYTNKDSLSVGLGAMLTDFLKTRIPPYELLEDFKQHPAIRPLLSDAKPLEYLAHLIPEAGFRALPKLYRQGVMVCGDAAMFTNAVHREGSNFALISGIFAGETALLAHQRKDYSEKTLAEYEKKVRNSFIYADLKKYRNLTPTMEKKRTDFLEFYPGWLAFAAREILTVDGTPKREKEKKIWQALKKQKTLPGVLADLYSLYKGVEG